MADMQKITDLLTEISMSTAFTPDALDKFKAALTKVKSLEEANTKLQLDLASLNKTLAASSNQLNEISEREKKAFQREEALAKREAAITELEKKVAVAEAKEGVRKEVFDTLFKGRVVREKFQDMVSGGVTQNGVYNSTSETHNVDRTTTEE